MAKKLLDTIKFLLRLISCISICLLVVIVFMQVINRNFFDHSFTWVEEVASMAMVFITYLGAAMATINNGNTRIDFFIRKLPTRCITPSSYSTTLSVSRFWSSCPPSPISR